MVDREESLGLPDQPRRYHAAFPAEGQIRQHIDGLPLSVHRRLRDRADVAINDEDDNFIDLENTPHSDRIPSAWVTLPSEVTSVTEANGFRGDIAVMYRMDFENMWSIGAENPQHLYHRFGIAGIRGLSPLPEDTRIMVGGQALRMDQRSPFPDLSGPINRHTTEIAVNASSNNAPEPSIFDLRFAARRASTQSIHTAPSTESYESALLDQAYSSRQHNPATNMDDFTPHWHRYPPQANLYNSRSREGNTPTRGFAWTYSGRYRNGTLNYPEDALHTRDGALTPGRRAHVATFAARVRDQVLSHAIIVSIPRPITSPTMQHNLALTLGARAIPNFTRLINADWLSRFGGQTGWTYELHDLGTPADMMASLVYEDYRRRSLPGEFRLIDLRPNTVARSTTEYYRRVATGYPYDAITLPGGNPTPSPGGTRVERTMQKYMNTVIRYLMQQFQEPHPGYHFWDRAAEHALHTTRLRVGTQAIGDDDLPIARHEIYVSALRIMLAAARLRLGADTPSIVYTYAEFLELAQRTVYVDDPAPLSHYLPLTALTVGALDDTPYPSSPHSSSNSSSSSSSSDSSEPPPAQIMNIVEIEMEDEDDEDDSDEDSDGETWLGINWMDDLNANFISHYEHRRCRDILGARHTCLQVNSRFMDARHLIVLRRLEARDALVPPGPVHRADTELRHTDRSLHEFRSWLADGTGFPWPHDAEVNRHLRLKATFTRHIAQITSAIRRAIWPAPPIHPSLIRVEGNWPGITWFLQDQLSVFAPASWNLKCLDCNGYDAFIFRTLYMRYRDPRHRSYMCVNCRSINVVHGGAHHAVRPVHPRFQSHSSDVSQFHRALSVHSTREGYANSDTSDSSWCSDVESDDERTHDHADDSMLHTAAWKAATSFESADAVHARREEQFTFFNNDYYASSGDGSVCHMKHYALRMQIHMLLHVARHGQEPSLRMCIDTLDAAGNVTHGNPSRFIQLVLPYLAPVIEGMFRCMHCLSLNGPTLPVVHHHWCPCRGTDMRGVPEIMGPDDYASTWWGVGITHLRQHIATIDERLARMRPLTRACKAYRGDTDLTVSPQQMAEHRAMTGGRSTFPVPPETFNIRDRHDAALVIGRIPSLGNAFIAAANDAMFDVHVASQLALHPARHDPRITSLVSFASSLTPPRLTGDRMASTPRNILLAEAGHGVAPPESSSSDSSALTYETPAEFQSAREAHAYAEDIIARHPERNLTFLNDNLDYMIHGFDDLEDRIDVFGGPWVRDFPVEITDVARPHDRALMHFSSLPSTRANYVDVLNGRHARNDARARWERVARERFHRNIFADIRPSATNAALGAGFSTTRDFRYWEHQLLTHLAFIKPSFGDEGVMLPCEVVGQDLSHVDSAILYWDRYFRLDEPSRHMQIDDNVCIGYPAQLDAYGGEEDRPRLHCEDRFAGMALEPYPGYPPDMRCYDLVNHPLRIGTPNRARSTHGFHIAASFAPRGNWRQRADVTAFLRWVARLESLARTLLFLYNRLRRAILAEDENDPGMVVIRDTVENQWPRIKLPQLELPQLVGDVADMKHLYPRSHIWPENFNHAFRDLGLFPGHPPIEWQPFRNLALLQRALAMRGMRRTPDLTTHAHMDDFWRYVEEHEKKQGLNQRNIYRDGTRVPRVPQRGIPHEFVRIAGFPQTYVEDDENRIDMRGFDNPRFIALDLALPETAFRDCTRDRFGRPARYSRNAFRTLIGDNTREAVRNLRATWEATQHRHVAAHARPPLTFPIMAAQADPPPLFSVVLREDAREDRAHFRHMVRSIRVAIGRAYPFPCARRSPAPGRAPTYGFRLINAARAQWRRCLAHVMASLHMSCFEADWTPPGHQDSSRFGELGFPQVLGRVRLFFSPADPPHDVDMIMHDIELGFTEPQPALPPSAALQPAAYRSPISAGVRRRYPGQEALAVDDGPLDPGEQHFYAPDIDNIPNLCVLCGRRIPDGRSWLICFRCDPYPPDQYARHRIIHLSEPHRSHAAFRLHSLHHCGRGAWALGGNGGGNGTFNGADIYRTTHEVPDFVTDQAWAVITHSGFIVRRGERFMG